MWWDNTRLFLWVTVCTYIFLLLLAGSTRRQKHDGPGRALLDHVRDSHPMEHLSDLWKAIGFSMGDRRGPLVRFIHTLAVPSLLSNFKKQVKGKSLSGGVLFLFKHENVLPDRHDERGDARAALPPSRGTFTSKESQFTNERLGCRSCARLGSILHAAERTMNVSSIWCTCACRTHTIACVCTYIPTHRHSRCRTVLPSKLQWTFVFSCIAINCK